uniref:Uncharacterized protein n=1 Tax=Rousettus aegyptiacus TaxID=9407 RepID=A0A7J8GBM3_ROUAE|nr:hypothetical protein HJG63_011515 [Rousettus aegyptiacus]
MQDPRQERPRPQLKSASLQMQGFKLGREPSLPTSSIGPWSPGTDGLIRGQFGQREATTGMQSATQMVIREQRAKARQCPASPSWASVSPRQRGGKGGAGRTRNPELFWNPQVSSGVSMVDAGSCLLP